MSGYMNVVMPQLGGTGKEGIVAAWHVKIGDRVAADDLLLDIETDKVSAEIPAPATGTIAEILVAEGQTVGVGTVLAVIRPDAIAADAHPVIPPGHVEAPPPAPDHPAMVPGTMAQPPQAMAPASPAVRRLFREHGLDAAMVPGTGQGGRIKRSDVLEYLQSRPVAPSGVAAPPENTGEPPVPDPAFVPFSRLQQETAEHAVRSSAVSSHVLQALEVDFTNVAKIRKKHGKSWREKTGYPLTYLPFIARAVCLALGDFPHINASVEAGGLRLHPHVHLAISVDLDGAGMVAPIIRNAESLSVARFADRIHALTVKARAGTLADDELGGGTYTISNYESFGTLITAPIIHQPQVAILSTDAISKRPVVVSGAEGDSLAIRYIGTLTHCFDHRAIDGAYSAAFLRRVKAIVEESDWLRKLI